MESVKAKFYLSAERSTAMALPSGGERFYFRSTNSTAAVSMYLQRQDPRCLQIQCASAVAVSVWPYLCARISAFTPRIVCCQSAPCSSSDRTASVEPARAAS
eukprot:COSAG01_NODE_15620_length_1318_cov_10.278097_2_plen_101_part_01